MSKYNLIVIGTSAGGVKVLSELLALLPADLDAAILIVMHLSDQRVSTLPSILSGGSKLPVHVAKNGITILRKHVYVAPSNCHMLVKSKKIYLTGGPTVNYARPAIDPLFCSAAAAYGSKTIGVLCSGMLDDGTAGLATIKNHGGITIVQDPKEAEYSDMPKNALELGIVDYSLPISEIARLLVKLSSKSKSKSKSIKFSKKNSLKAKMIQEQDYLSREKTLGKIGIVSGFTCPECNGTLWEIYENKQLIRFHCRTGHAYGIVSLLAAHTDSLEKIMWAGVRVLEESASIARRAADINDKNPLIKKLFKDRVKMTEDNAKKLRNLLIKSNAQNGKN